MSIEERGRLAIEGEKEGGGIEFLPKIVKSTFLNFNPGTIFFFGVSTIAMTQFLRLSMKWPELIKKWEVLETYYGHRKYLSYKYNVLTLSIIAVTFGEYRSTFTFDFESSRSVMTLRNYKLAHFITYFFYLKEP